MTSPLKARGIVIQDISKPKQTNTVQRWKLEVASTSTSIRDLTYDQYVALVVAFLDPDQAELYASRDAWESMQLDVIARLEALK